jgi:hypothetical protein
MRYGDKIRVAHGWATLFPPLDFETYSEAGYLWDPIRQKWGSLPGHSDQSRGIKAVGTRNYVEHHSFEVLCMAYDLLDGAGPKLWTPARPWQPLDLFEHVRKRLILSAWNTEFEWTVWNCFCVPVLGWPPLGIELMVCDMAKAAANSYPRALGPAGDALYLVNRKDPDGDRLIKKLTVPKNPTKKAPGLRWVP